MNDLVIRAAAIAEVLARERSLDSEFVEAVVTCCVDLIESGEPRVALDLIDKIQIAEPVRSEAALSFAVCRGKALRALGEFKRALEIAESHQEIHQGVDSPPAEVRTLRIIAGGCLWQLNRVDEALDLLLKIRTELIGRPDSAQLALCMHELASAELFRGRLGEARNYTFETIVSARRAGSRPLEAAGLMNLARIDKFLCRWSSANDSLNQALRISESATQRFYALIVRQLLAIVSWKKGELRSATDLASKCRDEAKSLGQDVHELYATQVLALIELHKGRIDVARDLLEPSHHLRSDPESRRALLTSEFIGDTYLEEGDAQTALDRYNSVWPLAIALVPKGDIVAELRRRRAEAFYMLGRYEEAHIEAKGALDHCRELGDRYEEAAVYRTLAQTAAKLGRSVEAKKWFEQGFAYYEDIETPYEWGKLWMAYGDWLLSPESGDYADKRGAVEAYRAAHELFERMGALGMLAKVTERLRVQTESAPVVQAVVVEPRRPARRPRGSAELERRAEWARETYGFVTRNKVILDLLSDVAKLAKSGAPLLILGESGTGKELVARGVHKLSERPGNFMPINCGALPREVIESELFGHVAGAFTGAMRDKPGIFESCHRGTVFLDEIAEMSLELQSRLLRFLESGEFRRVGSNKNVAVDTLIVAATNRDRNDLERGEGFRVDLYYRLAHAVVVLPPLRRRGEDLDLLIDHVLSEACERQRKQVSLSTGARNRLLSYSWPGNVRQLFSTIQRLVILSSDYHEIGVDEVALEQSHAPTNLTEELELAERRRIVEALAAASGVRTDAAKMLGMSRTTLISKMQRYGIR